MLEYILGFFSKQKTGSVAKDRLQVLLKIDRQHTSSITDELMEKLKEELMGVINKYLEIEVGELDMKVERTTDGSGRIVSALVANIPIKHAKPKK